ncbi:Gfo/Idh/MocA family protein [Halopelagius longus]|uniref:Gfo/Idh/MocA family oxidoreductase n=1 Tax=Halopelagius longus TaxID=1236180 RepID=A0A1H1FRT1_9EURY|nr:Gfo/Idh/MocA family oxidoreductase [Halopelagius longus]RDI70187.1 gfo/Idh/MocA family oxidoreductase [Halopelagius longus]SDR03783.1 Predicted dehydrogenase [Halopelagius longus]
MDNTELRIGIVGLGPHGTNHVEILTDMGHEVFGVDADPKARREFQRQFDTTTFESPADLFAQDIDAAVISTPNKFHEAAAVKALETGLDVLLEKPLAHTLESAERIAEAAERTGNICAVGFHHRYRNICQVAKSYVEEGYLGEVTHVDARFVRRRGVPGRGTWYTSKDIAGGGALMDVGAHLLDMLLFLSDWPEITDVMATARSDFGHHDDYAYLHMWGEDDEGRMYDVEDSVTAFCEFDNGMTANVEVAWAANMESTHSYMLRGTEAGAHLDITNTLDEVELEVSERNRLELYEARSGRSDHFVNSEIVAPFNDPYHDELAAFTRAVATDESPELTDIDQALQVQRAIDRIYRAGRGD